MANYYGSARSNYVKFKDLDGLEQALSLFEISINNREDGLTTLCSEDSDGGWPSIVYYDDGEFEDVELELDPLVHIVPFLAEGEVIVLMEAGAEKLRYLVGAAVAYTWDGRECSVSIDDIYTKAEKEFGLPENSITYAEY